MDVLRLKTETSSLTPKRYTEHPCPLNGGTPQGRGGGTQYSSWDSICLGQVLNLVLINSKDIYAYIREEKEKIPGYLILPLQNVF